jgi:hypothetical protein
MVFYGEGTPEKFYAMLFCKIHPATVSMDLTGLHESLKEMAVAAEAGTDLVEPDELRATTQENAAQEESTNPVQVQGIPTRNPLSLFACRQKSV